MSLTLDDLYASPDHYLHSFDGEMALFVPMDRAAYHRSIFLDGRISPAADKKLALPVAALTGPSRGAADTAWIFHMAHCGSTLLARALDDCDAGLVLREPLALRQIAVQRDLRRLGLVLAMLSKRYRADAPTLVKANVPVNFLLPQLIEADPSAHAILLYLPLRDYVLAILRNQNHRDWLRTVTRQLAGYLGDLSSLDDAQLVAELWLAQVRLFARALAAMPNARALNGELFFNEPARVLKLAAAHLRVPMDAVNLEAVASGPLFSTYSKNPSLPFDNAARLARQAALEREIAVELERAEAWVAARCTGAADAPLVEAALIR